MLLQYFVALSDPSKWLWWWRGNNIHHTLCIQWQSICKLSAFLWNLYCLYLKFHLTVLPVVSSDGFHCGHPSFHRGCRGYPAYHSLVLSWHSLFDLDWYVTYAIILFANHMFYYSWLVFVIHCVLIAILNSFDCMVYGFISIQLSSYFPLYPLPPLPTSYSSKALITCICIVWLL